MRPFDLEAAKNGAKVCTKEGKPARIVCYDAKCGYPLVVLRDYGYFESAVHYSKSGEYDKSGNYDHQDLMLVDDND